MERNGKWTAEEEGYTSKLIELFTSGQLDSDVQEGDTLRAFLSKKLNCKPMRVTKKFAHQQILGQQYCHNEHWNGSDIENRRILDSLRESYITKDVLVQTNRLKRKKYLKGSSTAKERKVDDYDSKHDDDQQLGEMMVFDWNDVDLDENIEADP
mmetsp:Transcript_37028/g.37687  ORF Transcript_37028/g.37687 Transcript_37028/m.37687 type:complete len:154 (-) Transcript_37028:146-607(-)|eukprot:CAMPEP_0182429370 /NCGR_PEP_ID=MMETSP1167-20130531/27174_1 /TAXON_ID=2988 /ORGANISM="Mallomonas Sp, Strain CCMP3275" /LENGTH=153 /DNA_ID=CAMNT_0024612931 /DNA_START=98 /DNA_END=559 /DNA_ORIENTATION=+